MSIILAVLVTASAAADAQSSVWSKRRTNREPPAAAQPQPGEYKCFTIAMGGSIATPYGAAPMMTPMPSAIGRLMLDGNGTYRHRSGKGKYQYRQDGSVIFDSGPFKGWATRSETDGSKRWLRFAAKLGVTLAPTSRLGDHICNLQ